MTTFSLSRMSAALIAFLVVSGAVVPAGSARHDVSLLGIGSFLLGSDGALEGANVLGTLDARSGVLSGFGLAGVGGVGAVPLFDSVSIEGFRGLGPVEGAGTSVLTLAGSNAEIVTADAVATPLLVQAQGATSVVYGLAPGVAAYPGGIDGVLTLGDLQGKALAHLVHVPVAGSSADALSIAAGGREVVAELTAGESVALHGIPDHLASSSATLPALLSLASSGLLAHEFVSDFHASALRDVGVGYLAGASSGSRLVGHHALETTLGGAASAAASRVLAHDLDYEVLAAQAPPDVAAYLDGALLPALPSAEAFSAAAARGELGYHAAVAEGRALVLSAVPATGQHVVTLANVASFAGNPPALAAQALGGSVGDLSGDLAVVGDLSAAPGEALLLGRFVSGSVSHDAGSLQIGHLTDLHSRTQILDSMVVPASSLDVARPAADTAAFATGAVGVELRDVPAGAAALAVQSVSEGASVQRVALDVASGVTPTLESAQVARLDGPGGYVGWIVGVAGPDATSWARLIPSGASGLSAELGHGASLLVVSDPGAGAFGAAAHALAARELGSSAVFGVAGQGVSSVTSDHLGPAATALSVDDAGLGALELTYRAAKSGAGATSFVTFVDGALPARSASDVQVLVDGGKAVAMPSAAAALSAVTPSYFVETGASGLLVLVNAASQARAPGGADVSIVSNLVSAARDHAAADLFGAFEVLPDGSAVGEYVQARADAAAGVLHDYTVTAPGGSAVVFEAIRLGGEGFATPGASGTHTLTLAASDATITLSDQTAAVLAVAAESARSVTFVPAEGVEVERLSSDLVALNGPHGLVGALMLSDVAGAAAGSGELMLSLPPGADPGSWVRGVDPINVQAAMESGDQVIFRSFSGLEAELDAPERLQLAAAIASGDVGGQVIVQRASDLAGSTVFGAGPAALDATTSFQTSLDIVTAATADSVTVTLSSALERGRTVLLSLDAGTVPGLAKGAAEILVDGEPVAQASSYVDVLDPLDDRGVAEYWVLTSTVTGASQVLVSLPHFSVHTVTVREASEQDSDLFLWVSLGLGLVVVAQGVLLVRMRRRAY